jgi:hypothetical protein
MSAMLKKLLMSANIATMIVPVAVPAPAAARHYHTYRGHDGRYHYRCRRSKGTTGLLVGAGGGGLGAAALGAGPVGIAAGVIGGGLLGRHIDKRSNAAHNRRNGC